MVGPSEFRWSVTLAPLRTATGNAASPEVQPAAPDAEYLSGAHPTRRSSTSPIRKLSSPPLIPRPHGHTLPSQLNRARKHVGCLLPCRVEAVRKYALHCLPETTEHRGSSSSADGEQCSPGCKGEARSGRQQGTGRSVKGGLERWWCSDGVGQHPGRNWRKNGQSDQCCVKYVHSIQQAIQARRSSQLTQSSCAASTE
jgi:hypothetical protein